MSSRFIQDSQQVVLYTDNRPTTIPIMDSLITRQLSSLGDNTPGFRSVKKRDLPINSYDLSLETHTPAYYRLEYKSELDGQPFAFVSQQLFVASAPGVSVDLLDSALSSCGSKLRNRVKSQDINLAQSFAERHQVVDMLTKTAGRLGSAYTYLRHGQFSRAVQSLKISPKSRRHHHQLRRTRRTFEAMYPRNPKRAASDAWLELQYGWRPLLNDIYGSAKVLAENNVNRESDRFFSLNKVSANVNLHEITQLDAGVQVRNSVGVRQFVSVQVENELLRYSAMLGLTNPLLLAYELTPFSFVVDWFLPIGSYLSSLDAAFGLYIKAGATNIRQTSVLSGSTTGSTSINEPNDGFFVQDYGIQSSTVFSRSPSGLPDATFPRIKSPASVSHAITAIALMIQKFR